MSHAFYTAVGEHYTGPTCWINALQSQDSLRVVLRSNVPIPAHYFPVKSQFDNEANEVETSDLLGALTYTHPTVTRESDVATDERFVLICCMAFSTIETLS